MNSPKVEQLGVGIGLRPVHFQDFLAEKSALINWVEVISENYMTWKNFYPQKPVEELELVRETAPVSFHGVSLSLGSADPLDKDYLSKLQNLIERIDPFMVSDHLCWTGVRGENLHDLLPLPFNQETAEHLINRIDQVQNYIKRPLYVENISSYLDYTISSMSESEFVKKVVQSSGCGLLLDINNIYVNSVNQNINALEYIDALFGLPIGSVHLAGHRLQDNLLIDTHDGPVCDEVWSLFAYALKKLKFTNAMIEWDSHIPEWQILLHEARKIKNYFEAENA